jgi:hypothetical protein
MAHSKRSTLAALALAIAALAPGCIVRARYSAAYWDTSQCYWNWVQDGYGGHEQLFCWAPSSGTYLAYSVNGTFVRRYPGWYTGPRVVVAAPAVRIVQPRGVVVAAPPSRVVVTGGGRVATPVVTGGAAVAVPVVR